MLTEHTTKWVDGQDARSLQVSEKSDRNLVHMLARKKFKSQRNVKKKNLNILNAICSHEQEDKSC